MCVGGAWVDLVMRWPRLSTSHNGVARIDVMMIRSSVVPGLLNREFVVAKNSSTVKSVSLIQASIGRPQMGTCSV
eukprot:6059501-Amphidinium_carterae.3